MDFVRERRESKRENKAASGNKQFKCIVWDLDNTLWEGVLIEGGSENIRINQNVVDVIKQLDQRGILQSIASKNNYEDAMKIL